MPIITLKTTIHAPKQRVFDLSRSVELHQISTSHTNEQVVGGIRNGLMHLHDVVTWQAKHFGVTQKLTVKITAYNPYYSFTDEMVKGIFKAFKHDHIFESINHSTTKMTDVFNYTAPVGILGQFANRLFLKQYMEDFLIQRNKIIKHYAESDQWKLVLPN